MSGGFDKLFGGTDRSAQKYAINQNTMNREMIQEQLARADQFLGSAQPRMQQMAGQGFQGAANLLGGVVPQQIGAIQQGNMAAQNYLMNSVPNFQNALMGLPVNMGNQMQPVQADTSMFNVRVPGA